MPAYLTHLFPKERKIACITVGRANVDCYPPQGHTLDWARQYDVFVGGSPANVAAGLSRLQLATGIITRVGKDKHGAFITNYLSSVFGIDVSQVQVDNTGANTSLAFAERRPDADTIMYRNNVADLLLDWHAIAKDYITSSASVFISGTALTKNPSREAIFKILEHAKSAGTVCVMDIDYRPYGWKSLELASKVITEAAAYCDIVIGTREEFSVAGADVYVNSVKNAGADPKHGDDYLCATYFLQRGASLVVVKRDKEGSLCVYKDNNNVRSMGGVVFPVTLVKPYGAGDAFASCLLGYLLKGKSIQKALQAAAASASINISGFSCTEAMPIEEEIETFILEQTK